MVGCRANNTGQARAVLLLQFFFVCWSVCWSLSCPYLFLISPSFGTSRGLFFVIVTFPGYVHLYVFWFQFSVRSNTAGKQKLEVTGQGYILIYISYLFLLMLIFY